MVIAPPTRLSVSEFRQSKWEPSTCCQPFGSANLTHTMGKRCSVSQYVVFFVSTSQTAEWNINLKVFLFAISI
jgi:hypothetical protein